MTLPQISKFLTPLPPLVSPIMPFKNQSSKVVFLLNPHSLWIDVIYEWPLAEPCALLSLQLGRFVEIKVDIAFRSIIQAWMMLIST